jgi:hypothetical protein
MCDHDIIFTESIRKSGSAPPLKERYVQENALFGFFTTGVSSLESCCYGAYAIASMVNPCYRLTNKIVKSLNPQVIFHYFEDFYETGRLTQSLKIMVEDTNYQNLRKFRNVLIHRTYFGRIIQLSTKRELPDIWKLGDVVLNDKFTAERRFWISGMLTNLMNGIEDFVSKYLTE